MGYVVKITREPGKGAVTKADAIAEALLENGKIAEKIIDAMRKKTSAAGHYSAADVPAITVSKVQAKLLKTNRNKRPPSGLCYTAKDITSFQPHKRRAEYSRKKRLVK